MIIWMDRPLANDHPDRLAFQKWSSRWLGLLQMIIWMDRPLANDHPDGLASCKLSSLLTASCKWLSRGSGLLQMIIWRIQPLANDHSEDPPSCKWSSGRTGHLQMTTGRIRPLEIDHPEDLDHPWAICFFDWIEIPFFFYSRLIRNFGLRIDFFGIFFSWQPFL